MRDKGIGLVFAGGGGKGAYHIGVWKALREYGVDRNITAVSGTSVGALNSVLFAYGDYELAEDIWRNISGKDVFSCGNGIGAELKKRIKQHTTSIFNRDGLLKIINKLNLLQVKGSIPCYAACLKVSDENILHSFFSNLGKNLGALGAVCGALAKLIASNAGLFTIRYFCINDFTLTDIRNILLASSAMPVVFPEEKIQGSYYIDGGLVDNVPILPLYNNGYRTIVVVHCNRDTVIDTSQYVGANIIEIIPNNNQGGFVHGTLDFSLEGAARRIEQGYRDANVILKDLYEWNIINKRTESAINKFIRGEETFSKKMSEYKQRRDAAFQELDDLLKI